MINKEKMSWLLKLIMRIKKPIIWVTFQTPQWSNNMLYEYVKSIRLVGLGKEKINETIKVSHENININYTINSTF